MTEQEHNQTPAAPSGRGSGNKPVVVYILVLFIAAFLLMALSLLMHQRSNEEAIGELKDSISAMREAQIGQDRISELEQALEEAQEAAAVFQDANETSRNQASHLEHVLEQTQEAMEWFWQLNESYLEHDLEMCRTILETMEENAESPLSEYLTPLAAERYREIQTAVVEE